MCTFLKWSSRKKYCRKIQNDSGSPLTIHYAHLRAHIATVAWQSVFLRSPFVLPIPFLCTFSKCTWAFSHNSCNHTHKINKYYNILLWPVGYKEVVPNKNKNYLFFSKSCTLFYSNILLQSCRIYIKKSNYILKMFWKVRKCKTKVKWLNIFICMNKSQLN